MVRAVQAYDRSILDTSTESEEQECKLKNTILLDKFLEMWLVNILSMMGWKSGRPSSRLISKDAPVDDLLRTFIEIV